MSESDNKVEEGETMTIKHTFTTLPNNPKADWYWCVFKGDELLGAWYTESMAKKFVELFSK